MLECLQCRWNIWSLWHFEAFVSRGLGPLWLRKEMTCLAAMDSGHMVDSVGDQGMPRMDSENDIPSRVSVRRGSRTSVVPKIDKPGRNFDQTVDCDHPDDPNTEPSRPRLD